MAQQQNKPVTDHSINDRIEDDLTLWRKREATFHQTFGPDLHKDRDFLKAKLEVLQDIYKRHNVPGLNKDERISNRILRGQIRQLRRRLQPKNVILRFLYNAARLVWNVLTLPVKAGITLARMLKAPPKKGPNYTLTSGMTRQAQVNGAWRADKTVQQAVKTRAVQKRQKQKALARKRLATDRVLKPNAPSNGKKVG